MARTVKTGSLILFLTQFGFLLSCIHGISSLNDENKLRKDKDGISSPNDESGLGKDKDGISSPNDESGLGKDEDGISFPKDEPGLGSDGGGYILVWEDSFDGDVLNDKNWNVEVNVDRSYVTNNEIQLYQSGNVTIGRDPVTNSSCVILTAKKEQNKLMPASSGRINTKWKRDFQYGKIEARIKLPKTANGLWPAFWMLGSNESPEIYWPRCGEIDIMEMGSYHAYYDGIQENLNMATIHWGQVDDYGNHPYFFYYHLSNYSLQDDGFHLYTLIWDENNIEMYLDLDKYPSAAPYFKVAVDTYGEDGFMLKDYFRKPFYVVFNLAVGGDFTGIYDINEVTALNVKNNYAANMYIDFIKVYQK